MTRALRGVQPEDRRSAEELLPLVYAQLRRLAHAQLERLSPGQTLQPTDLVHEAWMRVVGIEDPGWHGRAHFFCAAARAIRNILVEAARRKGSLKRGGPRARGVDPDEVAVVLESPDPDILAVDGAIEELRRIKPRLGKVVDLRFYAGLSMREIAEICDVSVPTVERDWRYARAWLQERVEREDRGEASPPDIEQESR